MGMSPDVGMGARVAVRRRLPDQAVEPVGSIRVASMEGLGEMRSILNVLRRADEAEATQPSPGLAMLDALVSTANRAGLSTTVCVDGTPRRLPATVDLAAYRIIQESLTNAVRHAGPATATVRLGWNEQGLRVEVSDSGSGAAAATNGEAAGAALGGPGHGLVGMRERAVAVGGTFVAGRTRDGGYTVCAELPAGPEL